MSCQAGYQGCQKVNHVVRASVSRRTAVLQKIFIRGAEPHHVLAAIATKAVGPRPLAMRDALERVYASFEVLREERRHRRIVVTVAAIHRHGYTARPLNDRTFQGALS